MPDRRNRRVEQLVDAVLIVIGAGGVYVAVEAARIGLPVSAAGAAIATSVCWTLAAGGIAQRRR